jgi:hypothetical protein
VSSYWIALREIEDTGILNNVSVWPSLENSLWKRLWTCHITETVINSAEHPPPPKYTKVYKNNLLLGALGNYVC